MINSIKILFLLTVPLLCFSCANLEKQIRYSEPITENDEITQNQAIKEVDLVIGVFQAVNPWAYSVPEKYHQGMSYLKNLKAELSSSSTIRSSKFCEKLAHFFVLVPDNHSYFFFREKECGIDSNSSKYAGQVGLNSVKDKTQPWSWRSIKVGNQNGLLISILRFPSFKNKTWNSLKAEFVEKLNSSEFLIIDLRGNRGGDNDPALSIAAILWGGKIPSREKRYQLNSSLAFILRANEEKKSGNVEGYKMYMDMSEKQNNSGPGYLIDKSQFEETLATHLSAKKDIYKKPILILSDRENGSAGEEMIMALKHHPHVKIIGENSKGVFHFGNSGFFQLPYSGIQVHPSTFYNKIEGDEFIEKVGFKPTFHIKRDALLWVKENPREALLYY